jgi:hypothetical protein
MARHVWVIQSTGSPAEHKGGSAGKRRRLRLRAKDRKREPVPVAASPPQLSTGELGIWAAPDGLSSRRASRAPVPEVIPGVQWFDTEPAWLDPNGPRRAEGPDPQWVIHCGTLVGGPFRWVLERRGERRSRWTFLSVSGRPTPDEFVGQITAIADREAARGLVDAIRRDLPGSISES